MNKFTPKSEIVNDKKCKVCEKTLLGLHINNEYCGIRCRNKAHAERRKVIPDNNEPPFPDNQGQTLEYVARLLTSGQLEEPARFIVTEASPIPKISGVRIEVVNGLWEMRKN